MSRQPAIGVQGNYATGNQAFSMHLRFLTIRRNLLDSSASARGRGGVAMGFLSDLFSAPKPKAAVIIRNVLGEPIDVVNARDLSGQDLRGRNWSHADLSGLSLYGAQCDGINLLGARLYRTDFRRASLRGAELAFSYAAGANFRGADLRECSLYRAEIGLSRRHSSADFTDALVNEVSDIPEIKVFGERRL
jgi:uncharacterized protein YjbI with pentapeptide repeats